MATRKLLNLLKTKKKFILKTFCCTIFLITWLSFNIDKDTTFSVNLNNYISQNVKFIVDNVDSINYYIKLNNKDKAINFYKKSRYYYKQVEFYIEYNFQFHSKYFINGPLVNKADMEYGYKTFVPHGFQVLENYLYASRSDSSFNISYELILLKQTFNYVNQKSLSKSLKSATTIDMLRFEITRIMSLYLNGYDCTINKQNLIEVEYILSSFTNVLQLVNKEHFFGSNSKKIIDQSINYLQKNKDYDSFNRLHFITTYLKPLYEDLHNFYEDDEKKIITNYAINIRRKQFYDSKWLNTNYFSLVLKDSVLVNEQAELGKLLFFDPVMSGNNQRACASCHNPNAAFGGNIDFNLEFESLTKLKRNTPTLINALLQRSFFADGRALQLEDQVSDVLTNHKEMFSSPQEVVSKLKQSAEYKKLFGKAFKNTEDTTITYYGVLKSISEFERKLIALNSPFDNYIRGNKKALTDDEIKGYTIFSGKALCGSCHFFPLFNGMVPPFYADNEFEVIGVAKNKLNTQLDLDSGRYKITRNKIHLGSFKTPAIRNIEYTAPYMHNSAYTTLDEVIDFYVKGGGAGLKLNVPNQTLPFDSLQLSKLEIKQLKKFMLSLTDKSFKFSVPTRLPSIAISGLQNRKVGGSY